MQFTPCTEDLLQYSCRMKLITFENYLYSEDLLGGEIASEIVRLHQWELRFAVLGNLQHN